MEKRKGLVGYVEKLIWVGLKDEERRVKTGSKRFD